MEAVRSETSVNIDYSEVIFTSMALSELKNGSGDTESNIDF
jgi:hypothetical protein